MPRRRLLLSLILPLSIALLFLLFCSGLQFPVIGKRSTLNGLLTDELAVPLPPAAQVTNPVRVASNDPARYFDLTFPTAAQAQAFITTLRAAANAKRWQIEDRPPGHPWTMDAPPAWF